MSLPPSPCEHVFVIGLDGARGPAVAQAHTPNLDTVIREGTVTYEATSVLPSASFEAWGAMFHGVGPETHRLGGNTPCTDDAPWPSFMKLAQQKNPQTLCASFSCWEPINSAILEPSCRCHRVSKLDDELSAEAAEYIRSERPNVFFMQLDAIDGAGHSHGYRSDEYLRQITVTDSHAGRVLDAIRETGLWDQSLVIMLSDHGGVDHSHGSDHPDCMTIFWTCRGPGIPRAQTLDGDVNIMDTAAVVARAMHLPQPDAWDAKVPQGLLA